MPARCCWVMHSDLFLLSIQEPRGVGSRAGFATMSQPDQSLLRFTQSRLRSAATILQSSTGGYLAVEEWLRELRRCERRLGLVDAVNTYHEAFADQS